MKGFSIFEWYVVHEYWRKYEVDEDFRW
jgi:hypothetical protein